MDYSATEGLPSGLGFGLATFPPILCYTLNKDVVFFSFILPITLLMVMGITLLLLTIWAVHKVGLYRAIFLYKMYAGVHNAKAEDHTYAPEYQNKYWRGWFTWQQPRLLIIVPPK